MRTKSTRTVDVVRKWYVIDATGLILGRLATEIARRLRGKHKAIFTPHIDTGDFIVVINASKVRVTGNKFNDKKYYKHSGFPGGLKTTIFKDMIGRFPERVIELAVRGMLPRNPLGRSMRKKLKVYSGSDHPHEAQAPEFLVVNH